MRLVIWARAQEAVPLYMALKLDRTDPVSLLMGGMSDELVRHQIAKFESSPAAIMIATAAHSHSWHCDVEAMVMFSENNFVQSKFAAAHSVLEPKFAPPTPEQLLELMAREAPTYAEPEILELPPIEDVKLLTVPVDCPVTHRREGDEYVCDKCHIRYDAKEERPQCPKG